jgi:hypothetical protein
MLLPQRVPTFRSLFTDPALCSLLFAFGAMLDTDVQGSKTRAQALRKAGGGARALKPI